MLNLSIMVSMKDCRFCNDETQKKTLTCFRCESQWQELASFHERVAMCPDHNRSIAICGGSASLCNECTENGYYLEREFNGSMFGGIFVIKQREKDNKTDGTDGIDLIKKSIDNNDNDIDCNCYSDDD